MLGGIILALFFIFVPYLAGMVPGFFIGQPRRSLFAVYISGFIYILAIFQLMTVPIVILNDFGFPVVVIAYSVLLALMCIAGLVLGIIRKKKDGHYFAESAFNRNFTIEEGVEWIIFVVVLVFQVVMFKRMASFDGDDAYYVVESLLSTQTDTLYRIRPYTGLSTGMDLRHSLAVLPIWIAYLSRISGIHPTILSHDLIGYAFIPLTYLIYLEIGRNVLKKERKKLPIFMIFIAIMQIFGNVSIYTNATFLLTRTWQGKSMLANVCIPGAIWLLLNLFDSDSSEGDNRLGLWFTLFALNIVAALSTTSSVFLLAMLIGLSGLVLAIKEKNMQILLRLIIMCIPLVGYGAIFLLL